MARIVIVGAGAAGLMAAGAAAAGGHDVTVLEHTDKPAQKILVTGKGRCNLTNACGAMSAPTHGFCTPPSTPSRPKRPCGCSSRWGWR